MPSKQELMEMMENRLPGETFPLRDPSNQPLPAQPPAYAHWESVSSVSQDHTEEQEQEQQQQQFIQPQQPTIYTIQPAISFPPAQLGTRSQLGFCPSCHATQMTRCEYESSMMTHIIATILCFTTCCCCLPYFFDSCKSARHYCRNCGTYLGAHTK